MTLASVLSDVHPFDRLSLFAPLSHPECQALIRVASSHIYHRGQHIPRMTVQRWAYIVTAGSLRQFRTTAAGQDTVLRDLQPGELYGLADLLAHEDSSDYAEALVDDTEVYRLPRLVIDQVLQQHPEVTLQLLRQLYRWVADADARLEELAWYDTRTRLCRTLGRLAAGDPEGHVSITHDELARLVGTTRERVSALLAQLRREGLIASERYRTGLRVPYPDQLLSS